MGRKLNSTTINYKFHQLAKNHKQLNLVLNSELTSKEDFDFIINVIATYASPSSVREEIFLTILNSKHFDAKVYQNLISLVEKVFSNYTSIDPFKKSRGTDHRSKPLSRQESIRFLICVLRLMQISDMQHLVPNSILAKCEFWFYSLREAKKKGIEEYRKEILEISNSPTFSIKRFLKSQPSVILQDIRKYKLQIEQQYPLFLLSDLSSLRDLTSKVKGDSK